MERQFSEADLKGIAKQLSCPEGELGVKTGESMNLSNIGMTRSAIDALMPRAGDYILEIGQGNGGHIAYLLSKTDNLSYVGADISATIIAEAEKINAIFLQSESVSFQLTDGKSLPFENEVFDKIFTVNTIYFWADPLAYLTEIKRVLKPNGKFVLCFADKSFMEKLPFTAYGFNLYDLEMAISLLTANGFKVIHEQLKTEEINSNADFMVTRNYYVVSVESV